MKIANFADLHAGKTELEGWRCQWESALQICVDRGVDVITIAGDIFHNDDIVVASKKLRYSTGAVVNAVQNPMLRTGIPFVVLQGNHDVMGPGRDSALAVFAGNPDVIVFDSPRKHCITTKGGSIWIAGLPWLWNSRISAAEALAILARPPFDLAPGEPHMLLGHAQVVGARMGTTICEKGEWVLTREQLEATPFHRVCLGDFHRRQDLLNGRGGYVGALCQGDHGEEGNPAGFEIWHTDSNEVEWIELDEAPRFCTITVPGSEAPSVLLEEGYNVRVRIEGPVTDRAAIDQLEAEGATVEIIADIPERQERLIEVPRGLLADQREVLRFYATTQNPPVADDVLARRIRLFEELRGDANAAPAPRLSRTAEERAAAPDAFDHVAADGGVTPDFLGGISA